MGKPSRWTRWVRKHDQLLTLIGAFVIFLTFIVKEVYQDRAKDAESLLRNSETTFAIRDDLAQLLTKAEDLQGTTNLIESDIENGKKETLKVAQATEGLEAFYSEVYRAKRWLRLIVNLEASLFRRVKLL